MKRPLNWNARLVPLLLFCTALSWFLLTKKTVYVPPDELERYQIAQSLVERGSLKIGQGSYKRYSRYPIMHAILAVPFYLAGKAVAAMAGKKNSEPHTRSAVALVNPVVGATIVLIFFLAARRLRFPPLVSLVGALAVGFATLVWPYTKRFYGEVVTALALLILFYFLVRYRQGGGRRRDLLGMALAFTAALLNNPVAVVAAPALVLALMLHDRQNRAAWPAVFKNALLHGAVLLPAVVLQLILNKVRYGSFLATGYAGNHGYPTIIYDGSPGFSHPVHIGLYAFLFSSGKSVFLYSPPLILAVMGLKRFWRRQPPETLFVLIATAGYLLIYSAWWSWYGGECWGPRFTLPVTPLWIFFALMVLSARATRWPQLRRLAIALLLLLGAAIQIAGASFHFHQDAIAYRGRFWEREHMGWYIPQYSPLLRIWKHFGKNPHELVYDAIATRPPAATEITLDGPPIKAVRLTLSGSKSDKWWSVAELSVLCRQQDGLVDLAKSEAGQLRLTSAFHPEMLPLMRDGKDHTRWSTQLVQKPGPWLMLTFARPRRVEKILLKSGEFKSDYARGLRVEVSTDGRRFTAPGKLKISGLRPKVYLATSGLIFLLTAALLSLLLLSLILLLRRREHSPHPSS